MPVVFCDTSKAFMNAKNSMDNFFLVLNLFYSLQRGVQWFYYRGNYTFPWIQRGSNFFQRGGPTFSREGPNANSIETHITCDFPGGGGSGPLFSSGSAHGFRQSLAQTSSLYFY